MSEAERAGSDRSEPAPEQQWRAERNPLRLFDLAPGLSEQRLRDLIGGATRLLADELPAKYRPDALVASEALAGGVKRNPAITRLRFAAQNGNALPVRVRRLLTFVAGGLADDLAVAARTRLGEILSTPPVCATNRVEAVVRCVVGNPFRSVTFSPSWRTDTAVSLARQMYDDRDFSAMPILADALQDAGCESDDILSHCRDAANIHVRGCWVVDLVLGKE
jgi:hypothetical protein